MKRVSHSDFAMLWVVFFSGEVLQKQTEATARHEVLGKPSSVLLRDDFLLNQVHSDKNPRRWFGTPLHGWMLQQLQEKWQQGHGDIQPE